MSIDKHTIQINQTGNAKEGLNGIAGAFPGISLAAVGAAGALALVAGGLKSIISKAAESQKVWMSVDGSIKRAGLSLDSTRKKIHAFASEMQDTTGQSDEDFGNMVANLLDRGIDLQTAFKTVRLSADIAAGGLDSMSTAFKQVADAVGKGNVRALTKYGITVDKTKSKQDQLNDALAQLQKMVGGRAKSMADSFDVKWKAVKQTFGDTAEIIGNDLLPFLTDLGSAVNSTLKDLNYWLGGSPSTADVMDDSARSTYNMEIKVTDLNQAFADGKITVDQYKEGISNLQKTAGNVKPGLDELEKKDSKAAKKLKRMLFDLSEGVKDGTIKYSDALKLAKKATAEYANSLHTDTKEGIDALDKWDDSIKKYEEHAAKMKLLNKSLAGMHITPPKAPVIPGPEMPKFDPAQESKELDDSNALYIKKEKEKNAKLTELQKEQLKKKEESRQQDIYNTIEYNREKYSVLVDGLGEVGDELNTFLTDNLGLFGDTANNIFQSVGATMISSLSTKALDRFTDKLLAGQNAFGGLSKIMSGFSAGSKSVVKSTLNIVAALGKEIFQVAKLIGKYIALAAVQAAKAVSHIPVIGVPLAIAAAAAVVAGLGKIVGAFDDPANDIVAEKWGIDAGNNFVKGFRKATAAPQFGEMAVGALQQGFDYNSGGSTYNSTNSNHLTFVIQSGATLDEAAADKILNKLPKILKDNNLDLGELSYYDIQRG